MNTEIPWLEGKTFRPAVLARAIAMKDPFICSPVDEGGRGVRLLVYRSGVFRSDGESQARSLVNVVLGDQSRPERIQAVVELLKERVKVEEDKLNPEALNFVNVENGMLDWRVGKLHPHEYNFFSTFQIRASYSPEVKAERVDRFLAEVFPPDALALAEELLGYLMLPSNKQQRAFMLLGEGANGKSTFLNMLTAWLGEGNVSHVSLQDLVANKFRRFRV